MGLVTEEYQTMVLDDLASIEGLYHPVKTSFLTRLFFRRTNIKKLHPNPEDEFSNPSIGPSYDIISNYEEQIRYNLDMDLPPLMERIVVEKISTGGYMILNGHHRWFACHRMGIKRVPIDIVNIVSDEEIMTKVNGLSHNRMVAFDLDEVLLVDTSLTPHINRKLSLSGKYLNRKVLRTNVASLINELHKQGFDVWIFTAGYASVRYIETLFKAHRTYVDGVINGMKSRKRRSSTNKVFAGKYTTVVHMDLEHITWTSETACECVNIETTGDDWAAKAISIIRALDEKMRSDENS